ncbi:MAG: ABC transporter substrate-binding protein [Gemmatimonadales bacterium]|nr:ABC transporter substrate-binding protein [Gemmatimonadales bacterium]
MARPYLGLALMALVACKASEPRTLKIGYIAISECLPLYVGIDQGFFEDEGLQIELESMAGGSRILEALTSQSIDIGFTNVVSLILQRTKGADFFPLVAATYETKEAQNHALIVRSGDSLRIGSSRVVIAVNTTHNIEELMVRLYLRKIGIDASTVDFRPIAFPQMLPSLESKGVAAVSIVEPFISVAKAGSGFAVQANHYLSVSDRTLVATYVTSSVIDQAKHDALESFVRAMERAIEFIKSHEPEARQALTKFTRLSADAIPSIGLPEFVAQPPIADFRLIVQWMQEEGLLTSDAATRLDLSAMRIRSPASK